MTNEYRRVLKYKKERDRKERKICNRDYQKHEKKNIYRV